VTDRSRDIDDAVETYAASYISNPDVTLTFSAHPQKMALDAILRWDDYSSWGEFERGQLSGLSHEDAFSELKGFRGSAWANRALAWVKAAKLPAIVLVDGDASQCIGDGRGRINVAMAFDISPLDVIVLKEDPHGPLSFTFKHYDLTEHRTAARVVTRFRVRRRARSGV
jgi:hypothetical protein